ncbi:8-amino-7-oxononanoate synthase, partial [bacterium]
MRRIDEKISKTLALLGAEGRLRRLPEVETRGRHAIFGGKKLLNLSSNDYLGLGGDEELWAEFHRRKGEFLGGGFEFSASSSRLLTGNHPSYIILEKKLSALHGGRAALALNSGYHANVGIIPALAGPKDLILSDKLNHASIIDGILLSGAKFKRYRHLDCAALEEILGRERQNFENVFIITESVFSMDGDRADLKKLVALKKEYEAFLIVDEAHGVGVFGEKGLGLAEEADVAGEIDLVIGTFGKALCSAGAYAVMDASVRDYLVNTMRTLIFTTGLAPVNVAWSAFILEKSVKMGEKRGHLAKIGELLRRKIAEKGFKTLGDSQIVPLIVGENEKAVELAAKFREKGVLVFP